MSKQSSNEIDQMLQRARVKFHYLFQTILDFQSFSLKPTNRELVRRDITQSIASSVSNLVLKTSEYFYNDVSSKELLCLSGTVACNYRRSRYNIPIEIWIQDNHPNNAPLVYVKPTSDMHVSPTSKDVLPDGTLIIPYIKQWRHVKLVLLSSFRSLLNFFCLFSRIAIWRIY